MPLPTAVFIKKRNDHKARMKFYVTQKLDHFPTGATFPFYMSCAQWMSRPVHWAQSSVSCQLPKAVANGRVGNSGLRSGDPQINRAPL